MKWLRYICGLMGLVMVLPMVAQDEVLLSQRDITGTARYMALAGAMTAVGGDAAAVFDNPAGLGVYRGLETQVSFDMQMDRTALVAGEWSRIRTYFIPSAASAAFVLPSLNSTVVSNNLYIGYRRLKTYPRYSNTRIKNPDTNDTKQLISNQSGYVNCYSFDWAINVQHMFYFGLGLNLLTTVYTKENEEFVHKREYGTLEDYYHNQNRFSGTHFNATAGFIYRPSQYFRLGASLATPSVGRFRVTDFMESRYHNEDKVLQDNYQAYSSRMTLPLNVTAGIAVQADRFGMVSFQYDYAHRKQYPDEHAFRVGLEGVIVRRFFLSAGYAYRSTFAQVDYRLPEYSIFTNPDKDKYYRTDVDFRYPHHTHYVSAGFGYHGLWTQWHLAYQYAYQREELYPDNPAYTDGQGIAHYTWGDMRQMRNQTHRIVLTVAFRH